MDTTSPRTLANYSASLSHKRVILLHRGAPMRKRKSLSTITASGAIFPGYLRSG